MLPLEPMCVCAYTGIDTKMRSMKNALSECQLTLLRDLGAQESEDITADSCIS